MVGEYGVVGVFGVDADLDAGVVVVGFVGFVDYPCCGPVGVGGGVGGAGNGKPDVRPGHRADVGGVLHFWFLCRGAGCTAGYRCIWRFSKALWESHFFMCEKVLGAWLF